jgi:hypothetical protein
LSINRSNAIGGELDRGLDRLRDGLGVRGEVDRVDPLELAQTLFPWEWTEYQREILLTLVRGEWRRMILLAPPRHRKTTIVAVFMAIHVGEDPTSRIMVASHTKDYSALLIDQVVGVMKTPLYKRSYGDLLPRPTDDVRWALYEKYIPRRPVYVRDPTFKALSPDSGTPGYGATLIVCDDLISQANSQSPAMRAHVNHWFHGSLLKRLEPDGKCLVIGARFYKDDLYGDVLKKANWEKKIYTSTPEDPLWPERWGHADLKQQELDDPVFFPAQYLQEPVDIGGSGMLDKAWFHYWFEVPEVMVIYAGVDPIIKDTRKSSKFSYVVVGRDIEGKIYILDAYSQYHNAEKQPELLDAMWRRWKPHVVSFESNGPQEAVMVLIEQQLKTPLNLVGRPSIVSKPLRLASIAGKVRTGKVLVHGRVGRDGTVEPESGIHSSEIVDAWATFPAGDVDLLDAFEKAVSIADEGPPPAFGSATEEEIRRNLRELEMEETGLPVFTERDAEIRRRRRGRNRQFARVFRR